MNGLKWAPISKIKAAGFWGVLAIFLTGGITALADHFGFDLPDGMVGAMVASGVGATAAVFAGYMKREEPGDAVRGLPPEF